jgi:hypothetical protein
MKTPAKKTNKPDIDLYLKSLLSESSEELGEEFNRLTKRIQTGYVKVFYNHSGIIRHNQHIKKPDSFAMDGKEVQRHFTNPKHFRAVNNTGYWLKPKSNGQGLIDNQYTVQLKDAADAIKCEPTKWVIKTIMSSQGAKSGAGYYNGYQLSPEIRNLVAAWHEKSSEELSDDRGFVNYKGESALEIATKLGGGISRDKSSTPSEVNVSVLVQIDKHSLAHHKKQVEIIQRELEIKRVNTLTFNSKEWKEVSLKIVTNEVEGEGEEGERKEGEPRLALGGVNRKLSLQSLLSKDFTIDGVKQRLVEINTLLSILREEHSSAVPVFYTEVSTGRYTAQGAVLQGYHKSVRYAALEGCYEYDLEAAHQNILIQLLDNKDSSFPELDVVREYVANKKQVRNSLAKELNTSVANVKEIIQELTYGAQLNRGYKGSIYKTCKGDKELLDRVVTNEWLIKLAATFKLAHTHLIGNDKELVNVVGIKFDYEKKKGKPEEMAHILQGYERLVLDTIIKHSNRDDIALLVHDCVVFYNKQSTDKLSQIVEQETGLCLAFSEEEY